ncbi:MAG: hypothetical protein QME50_03030 [Candidatus Bathyarchaeota archaeon]|nr:hypothetical protein [Candidatus Bathyarchaeota archaeon]
MTVKELCREERMLVGVFSVTFCMFIHRLFDVIGNVENFMFNVVLHLFGDVRMTIVQTSIPNELHKKLVEISKSEKRSIKEIVREAIEDWLIWNEGTVEDPFLNLKPVDFGVKTNVEEIEKVLYGRSE